MNKYLAFYSKTFVYTCIVKSMWLEAILDHADFDIIPMEKSDAVIRPYIHSLDQVIP